eukprot:5881642-Pyramimonas_sp.AAC.5
MLAGLGEARPALRPANLQRARGDRSLSRSSALRRSSHHAATSSSGSKYPPTTTCSPTCRRTRSRSRRI